MGNHIFISPTARAQLKEHFGCSEPTISDAIHFRYNSFLARSIRVYAVNYLKCAVFIHSNCIL